MSSGTFVDYYQLLSIARDPPSGAAELKAAYHRALLQLHPDKERQRQEAESQSQFQGSNESNRGNGRIHSGLIDIALIKEAYHTLATPALRAQYDGEYDHLVPSHHHHHHLHPHPYSGLRVGASVHSRPAQVVSLEDFTGPSEGDANGTDDADGADDAYDADEGREWRYPCRCGGHYTISLQQMEAGQHLVGCTTCSETIWAGYKLDDGEEGGDEDEDEE